MNRFSPARLFIKAFGLGLATLACLLSGAWIVGVVLGDTALWSQWLSWIPSLVLLPAGLLWSAGFALLTPNARAWMLGPILILAGPLLYLASNWRPGPADAIPPGLTVTQWTLGTVRTDEDALAKDLLAQGSLLNIVEGGGRLRWNSAVKEWLGPDKRSASTGIFSVISQVPIETLRSTIWAEGIHVAKLVVYGPGFEDQPLSILLVDLPSDPGRSREAIARRLQELLLKAPTGTYDLVVGDFNMPADSHVFATLFPDFDPTWPTAGSGWAGTYPREWPVFRIDHVLAGPRVEVTFIETVDPGRGRHRLQNFVIKPRGAGDRRPHSVEKIFQTN